MCVHDAEHDFQNSVFKVIDYVKYEFKFFLFLKFTGRWSLHLFGGRLVGDRYSVVGWSVGRLSEVGGQLVGGFKETLESLTKSILKYAIKMEKIFCIALTMFTEGFFQEKGSMFGFRSNATFTKTIFKISQESSETMVKLDQFVDVHIVGEE